MRIKVFTLFPEMLEPVLRQSILGRAIEKGLLAVELINIRDYTLDRHRSTDDYPFGGGAGMVMAAQPIVDAFAANLPETFRGRRIYLSPRGRTFTQRVAEELAQESELALLCGHYEGVDQRAIDSVIDEELSIGDYVLTGGELGALVVVDAVARLVPGVLGSDASPEDESFTTGLLEYPQYTRPANFRGMGVPEVLLNGNHAHIEAWRRERSLELTLERRPELLDAAPLGAADRALLDRLERARAVSALLAEGGIAFERLELRLADAFPKVWFNALTPEDRRKEARKQCFSGRRHEGFLWRAFSLGFAECAREDDADARWLSVGPEVSLLYLPDDRLLYRVKGASPQSLSAALGYAILYDEASALSWMRTGDGRRYCGGGPLPPADPAT